MSGGRGKLPLRRLAERRLPKEVVEMPKRGFSIPAASWLRQELKPMTEGLLFDSNSPVRDWLDRKALQRTWNEHLSGHRDHSVFIWGAMMFALWQTQRDKPAVEMKRAA
jgi:asparagine synthase (glutamine-hydrolysing)